MLSVFSPQTGNSSSQRTGVIEYCQNCKIMRKLEMDDRTLELSLPTEEFVTLGIKLEGYIKTEAGESFIIKEIRKSYDSEISLVAQLDVDELEGVAIRHFSHTDTLWELLAAVFTVVHQVTGYWWNVSWIGWNSISEWQNLPSKAVSYDNTNGYNLIKELLSLYKKELDVEIRPESRRITIYKERGSDKGAYFSDELNLKSIDIDSNSHNFYTEIEPYGQDLNGHEIDISAHTAGGVKYLSNYTYSTKKKRCIWNDNRYFDSLLLMQVAETKLLDICQPTVSYTVDVIDLAKLSSEYSFLDYALGDTVTIIDNRTQTRDKRRIIELTEYPFNPSQNSCVIGNKKENFEDLISNIVSSTGATANEYDLTDGRDNYALVDPSNLTDGSS